MDIVGPSGIDLLIQMTADAKLVDSPYTQSTHSRRIKAQIAEVMLLKLTSVSLEEFDAIKDSLEDLNSQLKDVSRVIVCLTARSPSTTSSW